MSSPFEDRFVLGVDRLIAYMGASFTIAPYDGSTGFSASGIRDQLVGAADEKNEVNIQFLASDYPAAEENDRITDADGLVFTVTKTTYDDVGGLTVQAFGPVQSS